MSSILAASLVLSPRRGRYSYSSWYSLLSKQLDDIFCHEQDETSR
ncbi:MAG: hypothetical protein ACK5O8_17220 [Pirellula sp.]